MDTITHLESFLRCEVVAKFRKMVIYRKLQYCFIKYSKQRVTLKFAKPPFKLPVIYRKNVCLNILSPNEKS